VGWAALALALAAACDQDADDGTDDGAAAREDWCKAACGAAVLCGVETDGDCASSCERRPTGIFLRMTPGALSAQAECFERAPCDAGLEALLDTCVAEAWVDFPASPASVTTCEVMATPLFECAWFGSFDQCSSFFGAFTDRALEAWQTCSDVLDCDALDQCAGATLYVFGD
jgi:hypothetical protein